MNDFIKIYDVRYRKSCIINYFLEGVILHIQYAEGKTHERCEHRLIGCNTEQVMRAIDIEMGVFSII